MHKLVRLGPVLRGHCRTLETRPEGVELLDTIEVTVASWKTSGGSQRWLSFGLLSGEHKGLELFVPLEAFTGELGKSGVKLTRSLLVE